MGTARDSQAGAARAAQPSASGAAAFVAAGLSVRYGTNYALERVDLEVPAGVSVAVLGPNGSGKSTLFGAALGLVGPSAGTIALGSRRIAFVSQRLEIEPSFPVTLRDVVRMGRYGDLGMTRRFGPDDHRLVSEALAALRIANLGERRFGTLSGGQRQRGLLAQAMAQNADILLLDEPFTGVDAPTYADVRQLLTRWRDEGRTVMVATHDLPSAARDYDLVLCLNRRVVAFGPPERTLTETVLAETFSGQVVRVGDMMIDVAHHHHRAG